MAAQLLYYSLTTGAGVQTLGEEYCDILQVTGMQQVIENSLSFACGVAQHYQYVLLHVMLLMQQAYK